MAEVERYRLLEAIREAELAAHSRSELIARLNDVCRVTFGRSLIGHVFGTELEERLDAVERRVSTLERRRANRQRPSL